MMHKLSHVMCRNIFMILFAWAIAAAFPALSMSKTTSPYPTGYSKKCVQSTIERRLIAENHHHQGDFSHEEQGRFKRNYNEWKSLPPENRRELRHRMDHWRELSPEERTLYQKRYHQFQQLPPDERGRVREKLDRWDNLSPQEKDEIRRTFPRH
ncbi:MAG: DUF3106 domain-containing protein [Thermodesulfobacteriota bacterium]|nr:MAG: DUF3106 domain-containing protein [Thermodesulfobacteriota bacterium]